MHDVVGTMHASMAIYEAFVSRTPVMVVSGTGPMSVPQRRPWIEVGDLARGLDADLTLPADLAGEDLIVAVRRAPASEYLLLEPDGHVYGVLAAADVNRAFAGI